MRSASGWFCLHPFWSVCLSVYNNKELFQQKPAERECCDHHHHWGRRIDLDLVFLSLSPSDFCCIPFLHQV
uniref:Secreted protein n=1 Tax=Amphimedon queenslandica TaxID=400682 RepID=A0A1X7UXJ9_AMPQE